MNLRLTFIDTNQHLLDYTINMAPLNRDCQPTLNIFTKLCSIIPQPQFTMISYNTYIIRYASSRIDITPSLAVLLGSDFSFLSISSNCISSILNSHLLQIINVYYHSSSPP